MMHVICKLYQNSVHCYVHVHIHVFVQGKIHSVHRALSFCLRSCTINSFHLFFADVGDFRLWKPESISSIVPFQTTANRMSVTSFTVLLYLFRTLRLAQIWSRSVFSVLDHVGVLKIIMIITIYIVGIRGLQHNRLITCFWKILAMCDL
jgi:hypothetical protein